MFIFKMLPLWYGLIAASILIESGAYKDSHGMKRNTVSSKKTLHLNNNKKDQKIPEKNHGEVPFSDDEIWFDSNDSEDEDYEILDVEEDNLQYPSDIRNYESFLNYVNQLKSFENSRSKFLVPETLPSNDKRGMTYSKKVNDVDELDRFSRKLKAEDLTNNLGNMTYDLQFRYKDDGKEEEEEEEDDDEEDYLVPRPYTGVYDIEYATPEREPGEDRWKITPCVSTLRELYTCIFCSGDPSVRQQFLSCYELLPKRVRKQGIQCYSRVLKIPFDEGSDDMDYYHYLCKKFKSIHEIIACVASSLPELPKEKFMEEETQLAKYSYCLNSLNTRNCC